MKIVLGLLTMMMSITSFGACKTDVFKDYELGNIYYQAEFLNGPPLQIQFNILNENDQKIKSFIGYPITYRDDSGDKYWRAMKVYEVDSSGGQSYSKDGFIELQKRYGMRVYIALFKFKGTVLNSKICYNKAPF